MLEHLPEQDYTYDCDILNVVDGDTIDLSTSLGFDLKLSMRVRLLSIDTPETRGEHRPAGLAVKAALKEWVYRHAIDSKEKFPFVVETSKRGKFGRYLATVYAKDDGTNMNRWLIDTGMAKVVTDSRAKWTTEELDFARLASGQPPIP